MKAGNLVFTRGKFSGPVAIRYTSNMRFQLKRVELKVDDTPTDSEDLTIVCRNTLEPEYDVTLYTRDLSVGGVTDLVIHYGDGYEYEKNDQIDIDYANTGVDVIAVRLVTEILEE